MGLAEKDDATVTLYTYYGGTRSAYLPITVAGRSKAVFLNRRTAARYRALVLIEKKIYQAAV
jgi:hypothetical protein